MEKNSFLLPFASAAELSSQLEIELSVAVPAIKLEKFAEMILEASLQFNLTACKDSASIYASLFYDSLVPYSSKDFSPSAKVVDVGSGAGVPGLLLKLAFPQIALTIIEANAKKCAFIAKCASALGLREVTVQCRRAEQAGIEERERFDVATARAVAALPALLELLAPLIKVGGLVICPKSHKYDAELALAQRAIARLGLDRPKLRSFVSKTGVQHNVAVFKKLMPTPVEFPRKWAQILSDPL